MTSRLEVVECHTIDRDTREIGTRALLRTDRDGVFGARNLVFALYNDGRLFVVQFTRSDDDGLTGLSGYVRDVRHLRLSLFSSACDRKRHGIVEFIRSKALDERAVQQNSIQRSYIAQRTGYTYPIGLLYTALCGNGC